MFETTNQLDDMLEKARAIQKAPPSHHRQGQWLKA